MKLPEYIEKKIVSRMEIADLLRNDHDQEKKIVFTNGCFDILHPGHILVLSEAKKLGDILVVGLNTDASVKRLKGENRPVNNEMSRAIVLAAIQYVDYVVLFDEATPLKLIKEVSPKILVKGGDYKADEVVGADIVQANSGEVVIIPLLEGFSTTGIIEKIS